MTDNTRIRRHSRRRRRDVDALPEEFVAAEPEPRRRAFTPIELNEELHRLEEEFPPFSSPTPDQPRSQPPMVVDLTNEDDVVRERSPSPGFMDFHAGIFSFPLIFSTFFEGAPHRSPSNRNSTDQRDQSSLMAHYGSGYWKRRREAAKSQKNGESKEAIDLEEDDELFDSPKSEPQRQTDENGTQKSSEPMVMDVLAQLAKKGAADASKSAPTDSVFKNFKCLVCLDTVVDPTSTFCGHVFCEECILQAIKTNHRCPACRCKLSPTEIHPLFV